jgi:hypothetical protein
MLLEVLLLCFLVPYLADASVSYSTVILLYLRRDHYQFASGLFCPTMIQATKVFTSLQLADFPLRDDDVTTLGG